VKAKLEAKPTMAGQGTFGRAAYGGEGWTPRSASHAEEIGDIWAGFSVASESAPLESVLLHRPGAELAQASGDADAALFLEPIDAGRLRAQHDALSTLYAGEGVTVVPLAPPGPVTANQMYCADLVFMTPEGAILARPAGRARAGEERWMASRLSALGIPLLLTPRGNAWFEGADAAWLDRETVLIGRGLRTNQAAIEQITRLLADMGVGAIAVDLPFGTMHLMGMLRLVDTDLAIAWPRRTPHAAVTALRERGYRVAFLPDETEAAAGAALNLVCLAPRRIVMAAGNPITQGFFESLGIDCLSVEVSEIRKAGGAIGCLTAVLSRRAPQS
jgi:N-dimethylarginine dimethylaminohydrolase